MQSQSRTGSRLYTLSTNHDKGCRHVSWALNFPSGLTFCVNQGSPGKKSIGYTYRVEIYFIELALVTGPGEQSRQSETHRQICRLETQGRVYIIWSLKSTGQQAGNWMDFGCSQKNSFHLGKPQSLLLRPSANYTGPPYCGG